jgi:hypothetical protein
MQQSLTKKHVRDAGMCGNNKGRRSVVEPVQRPLNTVTSDLQATMKTNYLNLFAGATGLWVAPKDSDHVAALG